MHVKYRWCMSRYTAVSGTEQRVLEDLTLMCLEAIIGDCLYFIAGFLVLRHFVSDGKNEQSRCY